MPWSALPPHIDDEHEWKGTDWDKPGLSWHNKYKGWFAYGPRAKEKWARWRTIPRVLVKLKGKGPWRYETDDLSGKSYLSRVQYWTRWHFQIQWPFMVAFHIYWRAKDVPQEPNRLSDATIKKMFFFYGPGHRDGDAVYWCPSFFVGGSWK